jgi:hypothetical protein
LKIKEKKIMKKILSMLITVSMLITAPTATTSSANVTPLGNTGINIQIIDGIVFLVTARDFTSSNPTVGFDFSFLNANGSTAEPKGFQISTSARIMSIGAPRPTDITFAMAFAGDISAGTRIAFFNSPVNGTLNIESNQSSLPFSVSVPVQASNWVFSYDAAGAIEVRDYIGTDTNITIPRTFAGMPVIGLSGSAFHNNTTIRSVTIHENIQKIGSFAFENTTNLNTITFLSSTPPDFPTAIFRSANNLTTINVPIGARAAYQEIGALSSRNITEVDTPVPPVSPTIHDALEILKQLAGLANKAPANSTINDALEILKYLAGLPNKFNQI